MARSLRVEEVISALAELGGEAMWVEVQKRVTEKRGNSFEPYKDWGNFNTTMFQLVQQHCKGYKKFTGPVHFKQVYKGRFSLDSTGDLAQRRVTVPADSLHPETVSPDRDYITGAVVQVLVNAYERDPKARRECIAIHGLNCAVCGMNFEQRYGGIGRDFIHVHHRKQLSSREVYHLNPGDDLIPVCPNCHAMLHTSYPPLEIDDLKERLGRAEHGKN